MEKRTKLLFKGIGALLLFGLLVFFVYMPVHEYMHYTALKLFGHNAVFGGSWLRPSTSCVDCVYPSQAKLFIVIIAPYLFGLIILVLHYYFRNIILKWLSYLAAFDMAGNFVITLITFVHPLKPFDDFTRIIKYTNYEWLMGLIIIFGLFVWYISNRGDFALFLSFYKRLGKKKSRKND